MIVRSTLIFCAVRLSFGADAFGQIRPVIRVGAILPLTGKMAYAGRSSRIGLELALEEIRKEYPNFEIALKLDDSAMQAKDGVNAFNSMLRSFAPEIVITASSSVSMAIKPIAKARNVIQFGVYSTVPAFIDESGENSPFRMTTPLRDEVAALEREVLERKVNSAAILALENDYGVSWSARIQSLSPALQFPVKEIFPVGTPDFKDLILKIRGANPELILFCSITPDTGLFLKQLRESGLKTPVLGCQATYGTETIAIGGVAAEGLRMTACYDPDANTPLNKEFVQNIRPRLEGDPDIFSVEPYAALKLVAKAADRCHAKIDCLRNELHSMPETETPLGMIRFDPHGEYDARCFVRHIEGGKFVTGR